LDLNIKDIVVYTVLMGDHEGLNDQPQIKFSKLKHFCITDDKNLRSNYWEMIYVEKLFPKDAHRSQRNLKIRPHLIFKDYKFSFYIDNTIVLMDKTENFIEMIIKGKDINYEKPNIFIPYHSFRNDLLSEFYECADLRRDSKVRIYEQLNDYLEINSDYLKSKPYWAGILFRNHNNKDLIKFSEIWFANICRYSKRDQLSLIHSSYQAKVKLKGFLLENSSSEFHIWPVKKKLANFKIKDDLLIDFIPQKYILNISKKLNSIDKIPTRLVERKNLLKIITLKNFLKRIINKLKIYK
tara:strand:- start:961 stop:1848 length:888 start_codon:yes stop_codon:yes gene_type:complete